MRNWFDKKIRLALRKIFFGLPFFILGKIFNNVQNRKILYYYIGWIRRNYLTKL